MHAACLQVPGRRGHRDVTLSKIECAVLIEVTTSMTARLIKGRQEHLPHEWNKSCRHIAYGNASVM